MSKETEEALHEAIVAHMRDAGILELDELLVEWIVAGAAVTAKSAMLTQYVYSTRDNMPMHHVYGLLITTAERVLTDTEEE